MIIVGILKEWDYDLIISFRKLLFAAEERRTREVALGFCEGRDG
jgi:hypothetical protein